MKIHYLLTFITIILISLLSENYVPKIGKEAHANDGRDTSLYAVNTSFRS
ncbi:hypothetical protein [Flavobacterium gelatinilyticum]|nr:hypothetical protein [Flavobacterium gelatinilyticum]